MANPRNLGDIAPLISKLSGNFIFSTNTPIGLNGTNYGISGQVFTSNGSGSAQLGKL